MQDSFSIACDGVSVAWTGGIKELLLQKKQREQLIHAAECANDEGCSMRSGDVEDEYGLTAEPTSVLDVSDRFSPPLTASSMQTSCISYSDQYSDDALTHLPVVMDHMNGDDDDDNVYWSSCSQSLPDSFMSLYAHHHPRHQLVLNTATDQLLADTWDINIAAAAEEELSHIDVDNSCCCTAPTSARPSPAHMTESTSICWAYGEQLRYDDVAAKLGTVTPAAGSARGSTPSCSNSWRNVHDFNPLLPQYSSPQLASSNHYDAFHRPHEAAHAPHPSSMDSKDEDELINSYINLTEDNIMACDNAQTATTENSSCYKVLVQLPQHSAFHPKRPVGGPTARPRSRRLPAVAPYQDNHISRMFNYKDASCSLDNRLANHQDSPPEYYRCTRFETQLDISCAYPSEMEAYNGIIQDRGLQLVHLLLACAEAVAWRDLPLAASLLDQLHMLASYKGDAIQRVTYCFAEGLSTRLALMSRDNPHVRVLTSLTISEKREGLIQLYHCSPYLSFGFFAANQAILQAFEKKTHVHIVDLGMIQNLQWPGLVRALATRADGPPEVRITAFGTGIESLAEMTHWGRELREFASSLKVSLEFKAMGEVLDTAKLSTEALGVREGETLAINSIVQLHKVVNDSRGSLKGVLQRLQRLGAGVMTLIEQDASHNGPFFLGRFLESLHYYSAIFDSLEASLGSSESQLQQRMKVERLHYAEEIRNIVACEGLERTERHERGDQWRRQMSRAGFQVVSLKDVIGQARMLLSLYSCDGSYTLCEEKGCLVLGWNSRPIMLASAWRSTPSHSAHRSKAGPTPKLIS